MCWGGDPPLEPGAGEVRFVGCTEQAGLRYRQHVHTTLAQALHDGPGDMLVGEEPNGSQEAGGAG